jgi:hypothetical protein
MMISFVEQLNGIIEIGRTAGTKFTIVVKERESKITTKKLHS